MPTMRTIRLRTKLTLFNLISKVAFTVAFITLLPFIVVRINTLQTDYELLQKREQVIKLIEEIGIEPFLTSDSADVFGSYNILKEEFISLEKTEINEDLNFIEIAGRIIEGETIDYRVLNYSFRIGTDTYLLQIGESLETITQTEKSTRNVILLFLIFFILITLLLDFSYTQRILHPLESIILKLKNAFTPALFNRTPVRTSTSDFIKLDQTIIDLMNKIEDLFQKEKDITINISHELITPISIIRSKLENILLQHNLDNESAKKIEESLVTLSRLSTLVNSMLTIARLERQQYLKEDTILLNDLLDEIINEISPVAANNGISIIKEFTDDLTLTEVNRSLLFSMFFNVINNAVKNSDPDCEIKIKCFCQNGIHKVCISDNGRGMTKEQLATLFSRFLSKSKTEETGTGIGLAITKSIAGFHNISISVDSAPHNGTSFLFCFPKTS